MRHHPHAFALGVCCGAFGAAIGIVGLAWLFTVTKVDGFLQRHGL